MKVRRRHCPAVTLAAERAAWKKDRVQLERAGQDLQEQLTETEEEVAALKAKLAQYVRARSASRGVCACVGGGVRGESCLWVECHGRSPTRCRVRRTKCDACLHRSRARLERQSQAQTDKLLSEAKKSTATGADHQLIERLQAEITALTKELEEVEDAGEKRLEEMQVCCPGGTHARWCGGGARMANRRPHSRLERLGHGQKSLAQLREKHRQEEEELDDTLATVEEENGKLKKELAEAKQASDKWRKMAECTTLWRGARGMMDWRRGGRTS